jgi:hypothetical protein
LQEIITGPTNDTAGLSMITCNFLQSKGLLNKPHYLDDLTLAKGHYLIYQGMMDLGIKSGQQYQQLNQVLAMQAKSELNDND